MAVWKLKEGEMGKRKREPDAYVGNGVEGVEIYINPAGNGWTFDGLTKTADLHVAAALGDQVDNLPDNLEGGIYATREEALATAVRVAKKWCIFDRELEFFDAPDMDPADEASSDVSPSFEEAAVRLPKLMERRGRRWVLRDEVEVAQELSEALNPQIDWIKVLRSCRDPEDAPFEVEGRVFKWSRSWGGPGRDDVDESPR